MMKKGPSATKPSAAGTTKAKVTEGAKTPKAIGEKKTLTKSIAAVAGKDSSSKAKAIKADTVKEVAKDLEKSEGISAKFSKKRPAPETSVVTPSTKTKKVAETVASKAKESETVSKKRSTSEVVSAGNIVHLGAIPSSRQISLAVDALLQHVTEYEKVKKQKLSLPGVSKDGQVVFLQIGLRNMPEQALKTFKGRPIPLPHPYRNVESCSICMFVKDKPEAKKWLGDDYEKHGISKIISLQQLRTQYKSFQARRELADMYDAFIADDRIVCMLPKALGKAFYVGAKRPLPIRLAYKEKLSGSVTSKIKKALGSAFVYLSGVSISIRIGTTTMTADQLIANIETVMNGSVEVIPGKWKGVQSIFIKSEKSAALPIYEAIQAKSDE